MQTAITLYTLVTAAFIPLGATLGDILGTNRAFTIGLASYGVGSLTTALSPNDHGDAQLDALRLSLGAVALAAVLSLPFTRRLPTKSLAETGVGAAEAESIA